MHRAVGFSISHLAGSLTLVAAFTGFSSAATFQLSGMVVSVQSDIGGSGVDISGLVSVGDPWEVTYETDPTTFDGALQDTQGIYRHTVGGDNFLTGTAGNFFYEATNMYKVVIYNDDPTFEDEYTVDINSSDVLGMTGNFPVGSDPDMAQMNVTMIDIVAPLDMIPAENGDALTGPPDPTSPEVVARAMTFRFQDSSGVLVAQFQGNVLAAEAIPEPSTWVLGVLGIFGLAGYTYRRKRA